MQCARLIRTSNRCCTAWRQVRTLPLLPGSHCDVFLQLSLAARTYRRRSEPSGQGRLQLNNKKCQFASRTIKVIGHVVSEHAIEPYPDNVTAVLHFSNVTTPEDLRSLLGLASYFCRLAHDFAPIAALRHNLLIRTTLFVWTDDCEAPFQTRQ